MPAFWQIVASNSLLVALLAVGVILLGRIWRNPVGLHLLWVLVLLKLVTPPMVTLPVPWLVAPAPIAASTVGQASSLSHENTDMVGQAGSQSYEVANSARPAGSLSRSAAPVSEPIRLSWPTILGWLWGVGIVVSALRQTYRIAGFRRLLRAANTPSPAVLGMAAKIGKRLDLRRIPRIRVLPVRISPLVWSLGGRPQVLLPAELFGRLDADAQEAILAHELAHVRRKDHWIRLLELSSTTLFWWHPVVWWACRELQELEDLCCDALAVGLTSQGAKRYATALLDTLDFLSDRPVTAPLGATAAKPSVSLARRIAMLKNHSLTVRLTFGRLVLLLSLAGVPMALAFRQKPADTVEKTSQPAVERRTINKQVKDFPEKTDLSTPESAMAAFSRSYARNNIKGMFELSWVKMDAQSAQVEARAMNALFSRRNDYAQRVLDTQIVEVLTYNEDLAAVIDAREPRDNLPQMYSVTLFGRIGGKWMNLDWRPATERISRSIATVEKAVEKDKNDLWRQFMQVRNDVLNDHTPTMNEKGGLSTQAAVKPLPIAPVASAQPADGTPRVEVKFMVVDVPRKLDIVRRLPSGGTILSQSELKKLIDNAQDDKRASVLQGPRMWCPLGHDVAIRSALDAKHTFSCQVLTEAGREKDAIALRIRPEVASGQFDASEGVTELPWPKRWRTSVNAELKPGEAVAFGGWEKDSAESRDTDHVTVFLVQANYAEPAKAGDASAVERRTINKLVKDFPEKVDLSTPESAAAAFHRVLDNPDPKGWLDLSAWAYTPRDVADIKRKTESHKEAHKDELEKTHVAYCNAEIIEVLEYRDGLAEVISRLNLGEGSRHPYSARAFVRIDGVWKNFGENRLASLEEARKDFDRRKDGLWAYYLKVMDGLAKGKPVRLEAGDLSSSQPKRAAPIAPGEPLGISVEKADLMGRVEWAFMHGARDITARKTIEWGDVEKDTNGNRTIRYKFEATIWGKDVVIANKVFTFDAKGNVLDMEDVEGFPQKTVERPADFNTPTGMKALVEDFFTKNFHDITSRETIEWGQVQKDEKGNSSIRYKYRAKVWDKESKIMNQTFTFDPKSGFVSVKDVKGGPPKQ